MKIFAAAEPPDREAPNTGGHVNRGGHTDREPQRDPPGS